MFILLQFKTFYQALDHTPQFFKKILPELKHAPIWKYFGKKIVFERKKLREELEEEEAWSFILQLIIYTHKPSNYSNKPTIQQQTKMKHVFITPTPPVT